MVHPPCWDNVGLGFQGRGPVESRGDNVGWGLQGRGRLDRPILSYAAGGGRGSAFFSVDVEPEQAIQPAGQVRSSNASIPSWSTYPPLFDANKALNHPRIGSVRRGHKEMPKYGIILVDARNNFCTNRIRTEKA